MSTDMKLNSKELLIKAQLELGKSFKQISDMELCKDSYLKRTISKLGYDWKTMKPKEKAFTHTVEPQLQGQVSKVIIVDEATEIKPEEPQPNPEVSAKAKALAEALKHCPELLKDSALVEAAREIQSPSKVRVEVEKCHRHFDVNVKPGESCPKCIASSQSYEKLANARNHAPPCPKCERTEIYRMFENAGVIKVVHRGKGIYSCGNCQISYDARGEQVEWGEKDAKYFA